MRQRRKSIPGWSLSAAWKSRFAQLQRKANPRDHRAAANAGFLYLLSKLEQEQLVENKVSFGLSEQAVAELIEINKHELDQFNNLDVLFRNHRQQIKLQWAELERTTFSNKRLLQSLSNYFSAPQDKVAALLESDVQVAFKTIHFTDTSTVERFKLPKDSRPWPWRFRLI